MDFIDGSKKITESDLGDMTLFLQYFRRYGNIISPILFSVGLGGNIPIGAGIQNPISSDKNFVSGTVDPIFLFSVLYALEGPISINSNFYARPIFFEAADKTKSGSFYTYGFGVSYSFSGTNNWGVDMLLNIRGLQRTKDRMSGKKFENSGGNWIYLIPGVHLAIGGKGIHGLQISAEFEIPIHQSVNGTQLTGDWTFRSGLSYGFFLFSRNNK